MVKAVSMCEGGCAYIGEVPVGNDLAQTIVCVLLQLDFKEVLDGAFRRLPPQLGPRKLKLRPVRRDVERRIRVQLLDQRQQTLVDRKLLVTRPRYKVVLPLHLCQQLEPSRLIIPVLRRHARVGRTVSDRRRGGLRRGLSRSDAQSSVSTRRRRRRGG